MDDLDRAIIELLRREGRLSNQDLAARVGLTPARCLRRVRRLEAEGVITGYSAIINPAALGREFEVIIHADLVPRTSPPWKRSRTRWPRWRRSPSSVACSACPTTSSGSKSPTWPHTNAGSPPN